MTRPGIAVSDQTVEKVCGNPVKAHWSAVLQIILYLLRTSWVHVWSSKEDDNQMSEYVNADHAACMDSRKSVSGGALNTLVSAAISYSWTQWVMTW